MALYSVPPAPRTNDPREVNKWMEAVTVALNALYNLKSGTDQSDAGAETGEMYVDSNDDNTVKRGT
jgi:hypothetical protein